MAEPHVVAALKDKRAELSGGIADLVLADLDTEIGAPFGFGMAVHRRVEQLARIGLLVADDQALAL